MGERENVGGRPQETELFPLQDAERYWNGLGRWHLCWVRLQKDAQKKQLLYGEIYSRLSEQLQSHRNNYFNEFLLLSFHETVMKMQKNKARYLMSTLLCNLFEAFVSLATTVILLLFCVRSIVLEFSADEQWSGILPADFISSFLKYGLAFLLIGIIVFVIHKLLDLNLKYFKPKETWVRHSSQCYSMTMEIMMYLDKSGVYCGDENANYETLRKRILKIWEENLERFQQNMDEKDERVSVTDKLFHALKGDD